MTGSSSSAAGTGPVTDNNTAADTAGMEAILERMRADQVAQGVPSAEVRIARLQKVVDLLVDHQDALATALDEDYGGRSQYLTIMSEVMQPIAHLKDAQKNLHKWMKTEKRKPPFPMGLFGARAQVRYQPKGVVGIMSPWNYPIAMVVNPLCNALAAGNRAMVKPSEFNPRTAALMESLFHEYFPDGEVVVVNGGPEVGAAFAALPLNHLFFTGAGGIGSKVMEAAGRNLTPVTLELGGKSPVIIGRSASVAGAAMKIITGKCMNSGQACVSPDYVFVPQEHVEEFIKVCRATFLSQYPSVLKNRDYTAVVNERHYTRIMGYLREAEALGARLENLSAEPVIEGNRRIPLHLVINPDESLRLMQEEIFGPMMIVKGYGEVIDVIHYINARPTPLALYYFGSDEAEKETVLNHTLSGGVSVNEVMLHTACVDMPFGGVGASGVGNYHGREGFKTFSHARSIFTDGKVNLAKLAGTLPPYRPEKLKKVFAGQIKK
ncbi:MAG: coniferyl aldehyde dehydrogenase [Gammaproteobacteria bacterium]|nr:coniferyl aldehyde dehydrogenase [Gammaproteobacteria bacterium]